MPEIKIGDLISTEWWPESVENDDATIITDITSTTYIPGSPEVGVQFTAARTGRAGICVSAGMTSSSVGNRTWVSFEVYEGTSASGTLVQGVRGEFGISTLGDTTAGGELEQCYGNMFMIDGLTPGVAHYARIMYRVDGGTTNDLRQRRLTVIPLA